jgi:hypothetical protein
MERVLIRATCKPKTEAEMSATANSSRIFGLLVDEKWLMELPYLGERISTKGTKDSMMWDV